MKKIMTQHHILPESFWWLSKPNNLVMLRESIHRWIHSVFQDDTPIQRIRRLIETDKRVMRPDVYHTINNTLKQFEWLLEYKSYEQDCFNIDSFMIRLNRK